MTNLMRPNQTRRITSWSQAFPEAYRIARAFANVAQFAKVKQVAKVAQFAQVAQFEQVAQQLVRFPT